MPAETPSFTNRFFSSLVRSPRRALVILALFGVGAFAVASQLEFRSSYLALLPENAPEVREVKAALKKAGGSAELVVAVGGKKSERLVFAKELVERMRKSGLVQWAEVEFPVEFFEKRKLWLLSQKELKELKDAIRHGVKKSKQRANPMLVDLEEDDDKKADPWARLRALEKQGRALPAKTLTSSDGRYLFVLVKPSATATQLARGQQVLGGIQTMAKDLKPQERGLDVRFAGSLVNNQTEHSVISRDMSLASLVALVAVILLMTAWARRFSAPLVIGAPLVLGLAATMAVATLIVGHLNLVSGFLVAALVGLGVDFGVHLYLRYLAELPLTSGVVAVDSRRQAMQRAIAATFRPSLTSALTTSAGFFALTLADFRGFSEYGLIAGVGVLIMLVITFTALPPLALLLRTRGRRQKDPRRVRPLGRWLAWTMMAIALAFVAFSASRLGDVRFFNDFSKLSGRSASSSAFGDYVERELGGSLSPSLIVVDTVAQAKHVAGLFKRRVGQGVVGRVLSVGDLVPQDVAKKRALLQDIRQAVAPLRSRKLAASDREKVDQLVALAAAKPWSAEDVPAAFRRRLTGLDQKSQFVLVWPALSLTQGPELARWAETLDDVLAEARAAGIAPLALDENRVAARVLALVRTDGPRVIFAAVVAVLLVLLLDFRRIDRVLLVAGTLTLGILGMLGVMTLFDINLNLFNAVVLPTIIGVGIDNGVHLMHGYVSRGRGSIPQVVATTGRAALLSSATTAIGFGATVIAHHAGIASMGTLTLVGIGCAFVGATILLPALLRLLEGTRGRPISSEVPRATAMPNESPAAFVSTQLPRLG